MVDDTELMLRSVAGDGDAFWEVAARHREMVYRVVRGIVGCGQETEDVVQDAFLKAFRSVRGFDPRRSPAAWLRAIAANCAISACRRRRRNGVALDPELLAGLTDADRDPERQAVARDTLDRIHAAMRSLSPRQRAVLTLWAFEGLEIADVADALRCSAVTVRTPLHRARERLALALPEVREE